jgi:SPP1 gp7 family putative phage head morphogenesis protein
MAVTARTLRLQAALQRELNKIVDAQTRDLVEAWVIAWDEVVPDLTATLVEMLTAGDRVTRTQLQRSARLRKVLDLIAAQLQTLAGDAGVRIIGDLQTVIDAAGGAQASVIDSQLPPQSDLLDGLDSWSRVDARQIEAIVRRSTEQITSQLLPLPTQAYDVVRRELIRGVASGSNPKKTAARMVARAEKQFHGGLSLSRALRIARTETLDAHRTAAALAQAEHADVLAGWSWLAKLDTRTCASCWAQHGRVHDLAEPGPLDHPQGRCGRLPVSKSWADLGFDVEEPPSLMPDAADVFEGLSSEEQLEILGPSRYVAWVLGDYPMESWSQRRTADGWRDSFTVSPAPQRGGRVSRIAA